MTSHSGIRMTVNRTKYVVSKSLIVTKHKQFLDTIPKLNTATLTNSADYFYILIVLAIYYLPCISYAYLLGGT